MSEDAGTVSMDNLVEYVGGIEEQLTQINTTLERIANAFERLLKSGLPV